MTDATPRVNAQYLQRFENKTVRVLGRVTALHGETATIDAGGNINLLLNRDAHLQRDRFFEVVGKVTNDLSLRVLASADFGTDIDMAAVDAVVDATLRYRSIFWADE